MLNSGNLETPFAVTYGPFEMIKEGDEFDVWITGTTRTRRAKVVRFDENRGFAPVLEVVDDTSWKGHLLKEGDYVLKTRIARETPRQWKDVSPKVLMGCSLFVTIVIILGALIFG